MDDDDLRLNTLHRFAKQSPRLVLEEHGHCEVPAGCGGVVLRWRNPDAGLPVILDFYHGGRATVYLDGAEQTAMRLQIAFGDHLLAMHLAGIDGERAAIFLAVGSIDSGDTVSDQDHLLAELASAGNGTWRATAVAPAGQGWLAADFDDSGWSPLANAPVPSELRESQGWRLQRLEGLGATALGLPRGATELWIRKRFTLVREP